MLSEVSQTQEDAFCRNWVPRIGTFIESPKEEPKLQGGLNGELLSKRTRVSAWGDLKKKKSSGNSCTTL